MVPVGEVHDCIYTAHQSDKFWEGEVPGEVDIGMCTGAHFRIKAFRIPGDVKGHIGEKKDGLIDYKFSLCIENSHEKNYITEKFFDCILTNTIPIYYGCSNIKDLIPENCYILIDDIENINSVKELLIDINNNCDEIYQNMLPNLLNFKNRYFEDFNPLKDIIKLLKNG